MVCLEEGAPLLSAADHYPPLNKSPLKGESFTKEIIEQHDRFIDQLGDILMLPEKRPQIQRIDNAHTEQETLQPTPTWPTQKQPG